MFSRMTKILLLVAAATWLWLTIDFPVIGILFLILNVICAFVEVAQLMSTNKNETAIMFSVPIWICGLMQPYFFVLALPLLPAAYLFGDKVIKSRKPYQYLTKSSL